jgi:hypothetical protein
MTLIDGRNRLEALERAGVDVTIKENKCAGLGGQVIAKQRRLDDVDAYIRSKNIYRRHLTQAQRAALIVAEAMAEIKLDHVEPVSEGEDFWQEHELTELPDGGLRLTERRNKGGRGKKSPIKQKALEINATLPEEQQVGEATLKREIAKAEGKTPAPAAPKPPKPDLVEQALALIHRMNDRQRHRLWTEYPCGSPCHARDVYLALCEQHGLGLDVEIALVTEGLHQIERKLAKVAAARAPAEEEESFGADAAAVEDDLEIPDCLRRKPASQEPADGRSEGGLDDLTPSEVRP